MSSKEPEDLKYDFKDKLPFMSREYGHVLDDINSVETQLEFYDEDTQYWTDEKDKSFGLLGEMLGEILHWLVKGNQDGDDYRMLIFRKTIALCWCIRPDLLGNQSLRTLAKRKGINISVASLSRHTAQITKDYGYFHSGHKTVETKSKYSKASRKRHAKKGAMG